jgi:hypothetical protein
MGARIEAYEKVRYSFDNCLAEVVSVIALALGSIRWARERKELLDGYFTHFPDEALSEAKARFTGDDPEAEKLYGIAYPALDKAIKTLRAEAASLGMEEGTYPVSDVVEKLLADAMAVPGMRDWDKRDKEAGAKARVVMAQVADLYKGYEEEWHEERVARLRASITANMDVVLTPHDHAPIFLKTLDELPGERPAFLLDDGNIVEFGEGRHASWSARTPHGNFLGHVHAEYPMDRRMAQVRQGVVCADGMVEAAVKPHREFKAKMVNPPLGLEHTREFKVAPMIREILPDANYGTMTAYFLGRFGHPNSGSDPEKDISAGWTITTPEPDMFLEFVPNLRSLDTMFMVLLPQKVARQHHAASFEFARAVHQNEGGVAEGEAYIETYGRYWRALRLTLCDLLRPRKVYDYPFNARGECDEEKFWVKPGENAHLGLEPGMLEASEWWDFLTALEGLGEKSLGAALARATELLNRSAAAKSTIIKKW